MDDIVKRAGERSDNIIVGRERDISKCPKIVGFSVYFLGQSEAEPN